MQQHPSAARVALSHRLLPGGPGGVRLFPEGVGGLKVRRRRLSAAPSVERRGKVESIWSELWLASAKELQQNEGELLSFK